MKDDLLKEKEMLDSQMENVKKDLEYANEYLE